MNHEITKTKKHEIIGITHFRVSVFSCFHGKKIKEARYERAQ